MFVHKFWKKTHKNISSLVFLAACANCYCFGLVCFRLLNYVVLSVCISSLTLCVRALIRAQFLRVRAEKVFKLKFGWKLTRSERLDFLNVW